MTEIKEGYKETEIGVIPEDWEVVKLQDYIKLTSGKFNPKKNLQDEKTNAFLYPVYGGNGITGFFTDYLVSNSTIIIGRVGEYCGSVHLEKTSIWITDNAIYTKEISPEFNIDFLYETFSFIGLENLAERTGQPKITQEPIYNLKIPLPPLKEQEKIADILSTADEKIDAIDGQIQKAETLKKGLLQKLLSEGIGHSEFKNSELGKIPESWEVVELEKLLTFKNGVNASKEQYGKGYRFINVLDIINNLTIKHDDIIGLVDIDEKEFELYEVKYGDILFQRSSETRAEVGQSNVYLDKEQSATFGGFVIKGSSKQEYNPVFMNYLFKIPAIRKQITSKSGGSTRYNIGQSSLNQIVVQFPPLEEQKQIADILSTADEKLEVLRAKKEKYKTLKKGLLQKLLSGEIRV